MEILNNTVFETGILSGKGPGQRDYIVLMVKGTFELQNNQTCQVSSRQLPLFESDQHYGDPALTSAKIESDFVIYKPKTDIVLLAKGYSPGGHLVRSFDVSMAINNGLHKSVRIFGDRTWIESSGSLAPSPAGRIREMDLRFENAFGGIDPVENNPFPKNPIGMGYFEEEDHATGKRLPRLEDPNHLITQWSDRPDPACFAWYGKSWSPRIEKAKDVQSSKPNLPDDFDWEFNNGASPDLIRAPYLQGNETIKLENCVRTGNFLFTLPGSTPNAKMDFGAGDESVAMNLDTLCILMEAEIDIEPGESERIEKEAYLVWRGKRPIDEAHKLELLKKIIIN